MENKKVYIIEEFGGYFGDLDYKKELLDFNVFSSKEKAKEKLWDYLVYYINYYKDLWNLNTEYDDKDEDNELEYDKYESNENENCMCITWNEDHTGFVIFNTYDINKNSINSYESVVDYLKYEADMPEYRNIYISNTTKALDKICWDGAEYD